MKRTILSLLLVASTLLAHAVTRSEATEVSVLTCSPGREVYSLYGHTAIRVHDKARAADYVFNYGVFDFHSENFIWKFTLGHTDYMCVAVPYEYFLQEYRQRGSRVTEQVLNLLPEEAEAVRGYLYNNIREENRVYRYNFLTNNCTTRVKDCVEACLTGDVSYSWETEPRTHRQMLHEYSSDFPWAQEGNDLLLGAEVDTILSHEATCFLPEYYCRALDSAVVRDAEKDTRQLVKKTNILLEANEAVAKAASPGKEFPVSPLVFGCIVFAFGLLIMGLEYMTRKMFWLVDIPLMLIHGIAGCVVTFVFLFSQHPSLDSNWLVAVLNPLPLIALPYTIRAAWRGNISYWHHFMAIWMALFLLFIPWMPQHMGILIVPVVATLLSRHISYLFHYSRMQDKIRSPRNTKKRNKSPKRKK